MRNEFRITALVVAATMIFAISGVARADDRNGRRGMSTTEKVITGVAIAAAVGLTAYAISRSDDQRYYRGHYYGPRNYVAFDSGFSPYCVGGPYGMRARNPRGYWYDQRGYRFYRVPYVYNNRYDGAYNAGWERGYWAGYQQGMNDARMRGRYYDRFDWNGGALWGYQQGFGGYSSYESGFMTAFGIGYRHAYYGQPYGNDHFGFGFSFGYRR
jgi:hypothetical protein